MLSHKQSLPFLMFCYEDPKKIDSFLQPNEYTSSFNINSKGGHIQSALYYAARKAELIILIICYDDWQRMDNFLNANEYTHSDRYLQTIDRYLQTKIAICKPNFAICKRCDRYLQNMVYTSMVYE